MYGSSRQYAEQYRQVGVTSAVADADPHKLVALLLSGALERVRRAQATLDQGDQAGKRAFMAQAANQRTVSVERLTAPASPNIVQAGSIIPAALITGVFSASLTPEQAAAPQGVKHRRWSLRSHTHETLPRLCRLLSTEHRPVLSNQRLQDRNKNHGLAKSGGRAPDPMIRRA